MTTLGALWKELGYPGEAASSSVRVSRVTSDSREAAPGTVFVAVHGGSQDGHDFLLNAQAAGAVAAIGQEPKPEGLKIPYRQVEDSRLALARASSALCGHPSHTLKVIGVTGTSGKTTTTYLLESVLTAAGEKVGVIGTVNFRFGEKIYPSTHTTPGAPELQKLLAEMKKDGCTYVIMEVSSHALKQSRVASVAFDAMVFTNLSPEHLDFHPDMEDYFKSKAILFDDCARYSVEARKSPVAVINGDDPYGKRLFAGLSVRGLRALTFGFEPSNDFRGDSLEIGMGGISGRVNGIEVESALMGRFNASNVLATVAAAVGTGTREQDISRGLALLRCVPGRLERVENKQGIHVLVDYAHKPDALEKVLKSLREVRGGNRIITVFGCGGDRDRTKRPVMGRLACELSDAVFITSDNPRTEDPEAILREIVSGLGSDPARGTSGHKNFRVEPDRRHAIKEAISAAKTGDIVLIAGKGHEDYQILADPSSQGGTKKVHFDDREVAAEFLRK